MSVKWTFNVVPGSYLEGVIRKGDFVDSFATASTVCPREALEEIVRFPFWARGLVHLRRALTTPFGLSQDGPDHEDKVGAFPVTYVTDQEIVAGFDDKHLNFLVSVWTDGNQVALATWVRPHGWPGKVYLSLILPFHILIARNGVRRVGVKYPHSQQPKRQE